MTTHVVEENAYEGEFMRLVEAYRNNDTEAIARCQNKVIKYVWSQKEVQRCVRGK